MTTRVVLVDDDALVRSGLTLILGGDPDLEVVATASDGIEALDVVARERPDVVLMDIRMPNTDGLEATRRITDDERLHDVRVVILTTFDLDEYVYDALRAGASGFLLKDVTADRLVEAVRAVADGSLLLGPTVTRPSIVRVRCTPRNGRPGSGIG